MIVRDSWPVCCAAGYSLLDELLTVRAFPRMMPSPGNQGRRRGRVMRSSKRCTVNAPSRPDTDNPPTDFAQYLAQRLRSSPEEAEAKLASWLVHYVPLKKRRLSSSLAEEQPSTSSAPLSKANREDENRQCPAA